MTEDHRSQRRKFAVAKTKPEKIQPCSGLKPLPSVIQVQRSTIELTSKLGAGYRSGSL